MKRILFYSENFCGDKIKGGLEVATFRIAKALKDSGEWEVYNAFRSKSDGKDKSVYKDVTKLSKSDRKFHNSLKDFIKENKIDVVVNMSRFFRHELIYKAAKSVDKEIKVIFMQHFAPGSETKKITYRSGLHLLKLNPFNPLYWLRSSVYPLLKLPRRLKMAKVYADTYRNSDKVVLLSDGYISDYCGIAGIEDRSKFVAIPNIFEADKGESNPKKQKRVLILSRMDEIQKRISLALRIWANIEKDPDLFDWQLDIVGSGHNTDIVKRLIRKYNLQRAKYHGWQSREKFLRESAIMISTSEYEGLPLALLEAQAYGVVPVAFDSYASLKDVVLPFENGVVIERFGDTDDFTGKLTDLMLDDIYRNELSENARNSSDRFSVDKIASRWLEMLDRL